MSDLFDALAVLDKHGVHFVVIGGIAAVAHGYPLPTADLDITPSREPDNVDRLAAALDELGAEAWTKHVFRDSPEARIATTAGELDIILEPFGTRGYADLRRDAVEVKLRGTPVLLASLRDIIRMKEASRRPKDEAQLPALRRTLEVIRRREQE